MAYSDSYGTACKMTLTSLIVRRLSTHIINHYSLAYSHTHSLAQSINQSINQSISQSINGWIRRYVTHIKYHICDRKEIGRRICVRIIGNTMITY